jgi:hypothetical protein
LLTNLNLFQELLLLERTRAPPCCFPPYQSCLLTRFRSPINNQPKLKLPSSCQKNPAAQNCLPSGTSSLFGPSLLHAFYLLLYGLGLFVPDPCLPFCSVNALSCPPPLPLLGSPLSNCNVVIAASMLQCRGIHNHRRQRQQ